MKELTHEEAASISKGVLLRSCLIIAALAIISYFAGKEEFMIGITAGSLIGLLDWLFLYRRINTCCILQFERAIQHMQEGWMYRVMYLVVVLIGARYMGVHMLGLITGLFLLHSSVMVDVAVSLLIKQKKQQ